MRQDTNEPLTTIVEVLVCIMMLAVIFSVLFVAFTGSAETMHPVINRSATPWLPAWR